MSKNVCQTDELAPKKRPSIRPSRKGINPGQMKPFEQYQIDSITESLIKDKSITAKRDLALFRLGIDSMLRSSDLLSVRWEQILDTNGLVKDSFHIKQQKTKGNVNCQLGQKAIKALNEWHKLSNDTTGTVSDIGHKQWSRIIKAWAVMLRLDPKLYSTHSIRRTKASIVYKKTQNIEAVRKMLGHKNLMHTQVYLAVGDDEVEQIARDIQV